MGHLGHPRIPQSKKSVNFQLVTRLAQITGMSPNTIRRGLADLKTTP